MEVNTWINTLKLENRPWVNDMLTALLLNIQQSKSVIRDHRLQHRVRHYFISSSWQPFLASVR